MVYTFFFCPPDAHSHSATVIMGRVPKSLLLRICDHKRVDAHVLGLAVSYTTSNGLVLDCSDELSIGDNGMRKEYPSDVREVESGKGVVEVEHEDTPLLKLSKRLLPL